jgi:tungstate transport system substrate-binding protein
MKKLLLVFALLLLPITGMAQDKVLKMSTTTSTESSGLLEVLLPEFKKDTGIDVQVVAKGTGAAIKDGVDGNVDVIFVRPGPRGEVRGRRVRHQALLRHVQRLPADRPCG